MCAARVLRRGSPGGAPQVALIRASLTVSKGLVAHRWKQLHREYRPSRPKCMPRSTSMASATTTPMLGAGTVPTG